jgi:hypothetical protein
MPKTFNLSSSGALSNEMTRSFLNRLAKQYEIFQSRWFTIVLGLSKMINATVLMSLYGWRRTWDEKFPICLIFVILSSLTYLAEYAIGFFWWPNWKRTLYMTKGNSKLILCADTPFYSATYHIQLFVTKSTSFFQRLPDPAVDETFNFEDFFTENGSFLEDLWVTKSDQMIQKALSKAKTA